MSEQVKKEYVVVKYAGFHWEQKWEEDPKLTGVHRTHTAAFSYTGKSSGCEVAYTDLTAAEDMAVKMNESNPCGDYAVCWIIPS